MTPTLFLHGALGTSSQLEHLMNLAAIDGEKTALTFEGHGRESSVSRPFRIEHFAENVLRYMNEHNIEQANFFGYSMGGYVALCLAKTAPERVGRIATLGTVLTWTPEKAASETGLLIPEKIEEKVPRFAQMLKEAHPHGWKDVVLKTKDLLEHLGENPLIAESEWESLTHFVRLHVGDRDHTADPEETLRVLKKLPAGELCMLPATPHPIQKMNLPLLASSLNEFFNQTE